MVIAEQFIGDTADMTFSWAIKGRIWTMLSICGLGYAKCV